MNDREKLREIQRVINDFRAQKGVIPTPGSKFEGSCFNFPGGEMGNLFHTQLVHTNEGTGNWSELDNPEILNDVWDYAKSLR